MKDCVALVTGGAGHIGRSIGVELAKSGVRVLILDKNMDAAESFKRELNEVYSVKAEALTLDLSRTENLDKVFPWVAKTTGRLDFIVNNAAFYDEMPGWGVPFEEESYQAWLEVLKVNLLAPFFLVQKLNPLLQQSAAAAVVNISSIYGVVAPDISLYEGTKMTNPAVYGASKAGMNQLTRWLSTQLAPKVRVNTVTPGGVARGQAESFTERYVNKTPLRRMAVEEDVAKAAHYLLSRDSAYVTGHNLVVDGGWSVW